MSKHTPAPWNFVLGPMGMTAEVEAPDWGCISVTKLFRSNPEVAERQLANARLIAAAPELLEALRRLLDEHAGQHSPGCVDLPPGYDATRCCPVAQARAAIAKATGEQPC